VVMLHWQESMGAADGCFFHPSAETHSMMATQLSAFLSNALGW
jgi:hypothetical protein